MSIQTDLASLQIISMTHYSTDLHRTIKLIVSTLHYKVPYFDWVGVYLHRDDQIVLEAQAPCPAEQLTSHSTLNIPIVVGTGEIGKLVVRSNDYICFDVTDISTLERVAAEISAHFTN